MRAPLRSPGWLRAGLVVLSLVAAAAGPEAESRPAIVVTPGSARSYAAAVQRFADRSAVPTDSRIDYFRRTLEESLAFSSVFRIIGTQAFLGPETTDSLDDAPPPVCSDWTLWP